MRDMALKLSQYFYLLIKKTLWPHFMDRVQLPQGYSHFEEAVYFLPFSSQKWCSFYRPRKDERLSRPWSHPVVLNTQPLDWESSALTTRRSLLVGASTFGLLTVRRYSATRKHLFLYPQGDRSGLRKPKKDKRKH